ncbi:DUF4838 domain-containing protein [bacterium]|nr:DUF4838 domain-containing protein [bacterium]
MRLLTVALLLALTLPAFALTLADGGKAAVVIAFPDRPDGAEREAAAELAKYLGKVTGAAFEQVAEKDLQGKPAVFVGATAAAAAAGVSAEELDRDGFVIKADGGSLFIVGHDATATELGAHFFLQRYGGVRWYAPLELGEHVPSRPRLAVPDKLSDTQEPAWKSRLWSSVSRMDPMWEKRNLCRARYNFHHNLLNAIKPSEVYDQHPEWFPLINGQRLPKPPDTAHSWQPCFANQELATWVGQKIVEYFDKNPTATSYSLGINDVGAGGYCQCEACQALDDKSQPTFRDRPNYSNRVFTFMNRVAAITSQKYPDRLLGCLSYANCEAVPSFPVHPNIIPYLTNDRAQWRDKQFRAQDQALLKRWAKAARQLGVYDYYYGSGYVIPRFFPTVSAESIKFCHSTGVRAWYAEIYSNWGLDACKAWLASQLLWDVKQDPKRLVDEYYTNFFGPAKGPMKKYWDRCEQIWMKQPGEARWFKGFFQLDQLDMFPPEVCAELRGYLDQAAKLADSDLLRKRIKLYSDAFHYTELYSGVYWGERRMAGATVTTTRDAEKVRQTLVSYARAEQGLQRHFDEVINVDPLLKPCLPFAGEARSTFGQGLLPGIVRLADYYEKAGQPLQEPFRLSPDLPDDNPVAKMFAAYMTMRTHPETAEEKLPNPGFEDKAGGTTPQGPEWTSEGCPQGWGSWIRGGTKAELRWVASPVHGGQRAVMLKGAEGAACYLMDVRGEPGTVYLCTVYARCRVSRPERVHLTIKWRDPKGAWFSGAPNQSVSLPQAELKEWTPLSLMFTMPRGAGSAVIMLGGEDMKPDDAVWFDDCSAKQLRVK